MPATILHYRLNGEGWSQTFQTLDTAHRRLRGYWQQNNRQPFRLYEVHNDRSRLLRGWDAENQSWYTLDESGVPATSSAPWSAPTVRYMTQAELLFDLTLPFRPSPNVTSTAWVPLAPEAVVEQAFRVFVDTNGMSRIKEEDYLATCPGHVDSENDETLF